MWKSRALVQALLLLLLLLVAVVSAQRPNNSVWNTLSGKPPLVIARGGFSGIFPDSTETAYKFTIGTSVADVLLWCDVQLTKDGIGLCLSDAKLDNDTDIANLFPNKSTNYLVNGVSTSGYFSVDYTEQDLFNVSVVQGIYSRIYRYDGIQPILTVDRVAVVKSASPASGLWLNIQHDEFFSQHNLSMRSFVLSASRRVVISYISSPEVGFLRSITSRINPKTTKLVFRFLGQSDIEPSTNQTYGSLLKKLTFIKTFASGILVPKGYIWPVGTDNYLLPHTSLVSDAHKAGLEVFASDFANDILLSYNYSYDPLAEYLQFIDNGDFSVDGVLSDFPITPSEAIALPMNVNTLPKLTATNYEDWAECIKLFLAFNNIDVAIREDEPPAPTPESSAAEMAKHEKWAHSNRVCLMTMKFAMDKTIKDNIPATESAKVFLKSVGNKFKKFDKTEKAYYLTLLTKTRYDGVSGVRDHAMKLTNWFNKLKSMKVELGSDFLVWLVLDSLPSEYDVLRTSYNAQKEEWSIDELITILNQEEQNMKKAKTHVAQFVSHKSHDKKKKNHFKGKNYKPQFKKKWSGKSEPHSVQEGGETSGVKKSFNGNCKFCEVYGHKQADCFKFKKWLEKKKQGAQNQEKAK